jgi:hypothetical protein
MIAPTNTLKAKAAVKPSRALSFLRSAVAVMLDYIGDLVCVRSVPSFFVAGLVDVSCRVHGHDAFKRVSQHQRRIALCASCVFVVSTPVAD